MIKVIKMLVRLWADENGSVGRDWAIIVAVAAFGGFLWLNQLGGEGQFRDTLYGLRSAGRNAIHGGP